MQAQALTKKIEGILEELGRTEARREPLQALKSAGDEYAANVAALKERRAHEAASALAEGRKANVAEFDKEIAAAEKLHASSTEQAAAACGAIDIIEQRLTELRGELAAARAALRSIVDEEIKQRSTAAREAFNEAVSALRDKLAEVSALDSMAATLRGTVSPYSGSQMMINALRDEGLKVFTPRGPWSPAWLHTFTAATNYEALAIEFRAAGLDI